MKLGTIAKDQITGFKGMVTAKCEYLTGCVQYLVTKTSIKGGDSTDGVWFDESRLDSKMFAVSRKAAGGPVGNMPKARHP